MRAPAPPKFGVQTNLAVNVALTVQTDAKWPPRCWLALINWETFNWLGERCARVHYIYYHNYKVHGARFRLRRVRADQRIVRGV